MGLDKSWMYSGTRQIKRDTLCSKYSNNLKILEEVQEERGDKATKK